MAKTNKVVLSQVRIIGGMWRGRKLSFPSIDGLRPTPDRVRETIFNWLQPHLGGARCLDLFAGSGALGFEAASRGADSVDLVESQHKAVQTLSAQLALLKAEQCQIHHQHAQSFMAKAASAYHIVFIDPPYEADLWSIAAAQLEHFQLLSDNALIYLEYPRRSTQPELPENWHLLKEKHAGDVTYCLFQRS